MRKLLICTGTAFVAACVFLPSPAVAWFASGQLYSNLQWSPDGTKVFYVSRFYVEEHSYDMFGAAVYCYDLATGEGVEFVPGAIYTRPASAGGLIEIKKLYGFDFCSPEAGLNPDVYRAGARREVRYALYISKDFGGYIFQDDAPCSDVEWKDLRTGSRRVLAEYPLERVEYLKKSHRLAYTEDTCTGNPPDRYVTYLLDLNTGRRRKLGAFLWLQADADESRATVWRHVGTESYDDYRTVMSISLEADGAEAEPLLTDSFYSYAISPGGDKIIYIREMPPIDAIVFPTGVDLITGERVNLPPAWSYPGREDWSPDGRYFVLLAYSPRPPGGQVCLIDNDARKITAVFDIQTKEPEVSADAASDEEYPEELKRLRVYSVSWAPSSKYAVIRTNAAGGNLRVIDVEAGEERPVREGDADFYFWVGDSTFYYTAGGTLYSYDCEKKKTRTVCERFGEGMRYLADTWINDSQVLFVPIHGDGHELLLDTGAGTLEMLTPGTACDYFFAEDGNLVFRTTDVPPGYGEYWKYDLATGYVTPYEGEVIAEESPPEAGEVVVPSPDGGRVAVLAAGKLELRDADGANAVTLMERREGVNVDWAGVIREEPTNPAWSPAGDKVAWLRKGSCACGPFTDVWVAGRGGGNVRLLIKADTNFNHRIYGTQGE
jgi:hypothetical protein